ncbi:hypothetical protein PISMIDRAFT_678045 [Pisolithus microcarpus 441]|uniref:Uncharacterized protein n=1 Tax=Pisolithus microcarpus 441 TaxID=765257 RepID=A0A0C9ZY75_9AGAM|nr:hypothetical protein PISMIDRAFT_687480 [Pisolithus microcarpus 441]KIK24658.1 hypothetical protein PISMIDRAFT_678045 [Pisolithus microcarpus 441]
MSSTNSRQNVVHRRTRAASSMISPEAQMSSLHLDHSLGTTRDLVERNAMSTSFSSMPPDEGLHLRRAGYVVPLILRPLCYAVGDTPLRVLPVNDSQPCIMQCPQLLHSHHRSVPMIS